MLATAMTYLALWFSLTLVGWLIIGWVRNNQPECPNGCDDIPTVHTDWDHLPHNRFERPREYYECPACKAKWEKTHD